MFYGLSATQWNVCVREEGRCRCRQAAEDTHGVCAVPPLSVAGQAQEKREEAERGMPSMPFDAFGGEKAGVQQCADDGSVGR